MRTRNSLGCFVRETHIRDIVCERCGKLFRRSHNKGRFCSLKCHKGNRRYIDPAGYIRIKMPEHPHATSNGWVREHVVIACAKYGRTLQASECVHHIDGDKQNNIPNNLEILPLGVHSRKHRYNPENQQYGEANTMIECACGCGSTFIKYDKKRRPRRFLVGHHRRKTRFGSE